MKSDRELWGLGFWMFTDFRNRLLRFAQIVELIGIKFGQHHPAFEIVFAFFQFANDFQFRLGIFAKFDACHRA